jgi:hypothetical protein
MQTIFKHRMNRVAHNQAAVRRAKFFDAADLAAIKP